MKIHAGALRVGAFVIAGLALMVVAIAYVLGGQAFTQHTTILMRYTGSVYGLQTGSPVVFRGVSIGSVTAIGLATNADSGQIEIPVTARLDREAIGRLVTIPGAPARSNDAAAREALGTLIAQGLSARLATQSLLTGQLYVDLDLRPGQVATGATKPRPAGTSAAMDVPTLPTGLQTLQSQLEGVDVKAVVQDLATIASATRQFLQDPQLKAVVANTAALSTELRTLTQTLQREVVPLSSATLKTLEQTRLAALALGDASIRMGHAAERVDGVLAPNAPLLQSLQKATRELTETAISLRETAGSDAELVQNLNRASRDMGRAARQLGELTQLIERQPDLLLRGRKAAP